jgi:hypothetical protein
MHSDRDALERILARLGVGDSVHGIGPDRATQKLEPKTLILSDTDPGVTSLLARRMFPLHNIGDYTKF